MMEWEQKKRPEVKLVKDNGIEIRITRREDDTAEVTNRLSDFTTIHTHKHTNKP